MRDVLLTLLVAGLLPLAVLRPYVGLLLYSWLAYFRPQEMCWSFGRELPYSAAAVAAIVIGSLLGRRFGAPFSPRETLVRLDRVTGLIVLFWLAVLCSVLLAVDRAAAVVPMKELTKVLLVAVLTHGLCRTRERFRWLIVVIAGALGLLALKHGLHALRTGTLRIYDGPGGMMSDGNDFALALVMAVPLLLLVAKRERLWWMKATALVLAASSVGTIVFTRSRGALLALAAVAVLGATRIRTLRGAVAGAALIAVAWFAIPADYMEEIRALTRGERGPSGAERLVAWEKAANLVREHPATGVGPGNFVVLFDTVPPQAKGQPVTVHNTPLEILVESGPAALLLLTVLIAAAVRALMIARASGRDGPTFWVDSSAAIGLSLAGFLVGALFLTRGRFDLFYQLLALAGALGAAARTGESPVVEEAGFGLASAHPRPAA